MAGRARSAEAFAGRIADRVGGAPDPSTYRRWLRGDSVIPAWVIIAAAEESGLTPNDLLSGAWSGADQATISGLPARVEAQETELRTLRDEVAELREYVRTNRRAQRQAWAESSTASPPPQQGPPQARPDRHLRP